MPSGASTAPSTRPILAVNTGSSSLKMTVFTAAGVLTRRATATVSRIGSGSAGLRVRSGDDSIDRPADAPDFDAALNLALDALAAHLGPAPRGVGHRIVHGGAEHRAAEPLTPALLSDLRRLEPIDPTHMPQALALVEAIGARYPDLPQIACFDTSFHRTMPPVAQQYPLPRATWKAGIRRYGFHGLSCESIVDALRAESPPAADGRILIAHLGNGASVTAVARGASVDTTMGFSPTGGLMMGTRSGDLDPGVLTYLARTGAHTADALEHLVTEEAGLLGVSGVTSDMEQLLGRRDAPEVRDAIDLYCYIARKHIGALAAVLNGIDTMVFTGGIGEHAADIRAGICGGLEYLGVTIDPDANAANRAVISRTGGAATVRVIAADEDAVIARYVRQRLV
jgi:acetate kinase